MYYESESSSPLAILEATCPACGQEANLLVRKHEKSGCIWIIPWWSSSYFVTCGNCFATFKIDKELGKQLERSQRETERSTKEPKMEYEPRVQQLQGMQQAMRCPSCGSQSAPGQRFCGACGTRLASACPHCGAIVSPGSAFCTNCSARLY